MKIGGLIPWNAAPVFEKFKIYSLMGRRLMKDVFGQPFKGPIIPFGSLVEYHPITAKDQSRMYQFGKKVLLGLFLGYALYAGGGEFGRVTYWLQILRSWRRWTIRNLLKKTQCERGDISQRKEFIFQSQMDESNPWEEIKT